jgi:hypothetical protein
MMEEYQEELADIRNHHLVEKHLIPLILQQALVTFTMLNKWREVLRA